MTREEMLNKAVLWMEQAESAQSEQAELRWIRLSEGWLKIAAEIRKGRVDSPPVQE